MDRGRVGYDLVGNKFLREKALSHKRDVHVDRLNKIKNRTPGSSSTLDNAIPESLLNNKFQKNPRKFKKKTERNLQIQRQNKVLLQRISNILTAPPKISDADYQNMKKLIPTLDSVDDFTKDLITRRNKEFFERIKNTGAYYHPNEWEKDYQKQLDGQKFMRQVTYTRPKDWIDPFQTVTSPSPTPTTTTRRIRPSTVCGSPSRQTIDTVSTNRSSRGNGSHINRIKSMRKAQSASGLGTTTSTTIDGNNSAFDGKEKEYEENDIHEMTTYINDNDLDPDRTRDRDRDNEEIARLNEKKKKSVEDDLDEYEEDDDFEEGSEDLLNRVLAQRKRKILVTVLDEPVLVQTHRPMTRSASVRGGAALASAIAAASTQLQQQTQTQSQTGQLQSDSLSTPTTPVPHIDHRRTLTPGLSRRSLLQDIHNSQSSFRSIQSGNGGAGGAGGGGGGTSPSTTNPSNTLNLNIIPTHSHSFTTTSSSLNTLPLPSSTIHHPIMNITHLLSLSSSPSTTTVRPTNITYEIEVSIVCSLVDGERILIEIEGVDDHTVHSQLQFHPLDLTGATSAIKTISTTTNNISTSYSHPIHEGGNGDRAGERGEKGEISSSYGLVRDPVENIPYNWSFPRHKYLQNTIGEEITDQVQLCVRGGQEYSIVLPDPSKLTFPLESIGDIENSGEITGEDANRILHGFEPMSVKMSCLIPFEGFYPTVVSSPVRQSILTRQKTGWTEVKQQFIIFKPERIGMAIKVKRIAEDKALISGLVVRDSNNKFLIPITRKSIPALSRDSVLECVISLPSILSIDHELLTEYFKNAVSNIRIKHNGTTGENKFIFD